MACRATGDESDTGRVAAAGQCVDRIDVPGKAIMQKAGVTIVNLSTEEDKKFRAIGAAVTEKILAELDKKGLPARSVYKLMRETSERHAKTSKPFWR